MSDKLKIDATLLAEVGLSTLPPDEANILLHHIYDTLERKVGVALASKMTNQQIAEFEAYITARDDDGAFRWLSTHFPEYREVVTSEFQRVTAELRQSAPLILALVGPPNV